MRYVIVIAHDLHPMDGSKVVRPTRGVPFYVLDLCLSFVTTIFEHVSTWRQSVINASVQLAAAAVWFILLYLCLGKDGYSSSSLVLQITFRYPWLNVLYGQAVLDT